MNAKEKIINTIQIGTCRYAVLGNDWTEEKGAFVSPALNGNSDEDEELLIFGESLRNGSISANITLLESTGDKGESPAMEAALVVRRRDDQSCVYAGTGGFGSKFFIGKISSGYGGWQPCAEIGNNSAVTVQRRYQLRVEFNGSRIALYENDVQRGVITHENYLPGQCGLRTWRTQARFENVCIHRAQPRAFVIMPFRSELDFVHKVIEETVTAYGIECIRADQMSVSRPIMQDVGEQIAEADLVVVDFTGQNPNVYFEAGMAYAWKKDWILLTQTTDDLTFDIRHVRSVKYSNTMRADLKLKEDLEKALKALQYLPAGVSAKE